MPILNIDLDFFEKSSSSKSPIKFILSAVVFLFVLMFGIPDGCDSGNRSGSGFDRSDLIENARSCFSTAAGIADCEGCCSLGSVFDDSGCHCTGIVVECTDGAGATGEERAENACSACCDGALGSPYVVEAWLDDESKCQCEAAYTAEVFK